MGAISRFLSGLLLLTTLSACSPQVELDEQTFDRYIGAMQNLQRTYPDLALKLQTEGSLSLKETDVQKVEDAVMDAGFNDLREFMTVNSAVAWSITRLKTQQTVQHQQTNISKGLEQLGQDLNRFKAQSQTWWSTVSQQFSQPADAQGINVVERNLQKLKELFS